MIVYSKGNFEIPRMLVILLAVVLLHNPVFALRTTSGSPCENVCGTTTNTTAYEVSCLDEAYNKTTPGQNFEKCISCQLDSEFYDPNTGQSDVNWGLYNLRYAFSTCVFGYPESISIVSSPCPVACDGVRLAMETNIKEPNTDNLDSWCSGPTFADNVVNSCEFCYNLTTTQVYMANFLESIRYNCHFKTVTGKKFKIDPTRIFTQSLLPSSLSLATTSSSSSNTNLGVVIAVPIVGVLILLCFLSACCFFFIRHRRKKRRTRRDDTMYNQWRNASSTNGHGWAQQHYPSSSYGCGGGMGFMDNNGHGQEVAYGHGISADQQYQRRYEQHFHEQDKAAFSDRIHEQQAPVFSHVFDPDQKRPQQWQ